MSFVLAVFTLGSSFGNVVLRPSIASDITLFRVLAPAYITYILCVKPAQTRPWLFAYIAFVAYSWCLATSYSDSLREFFPSLVHYAYIFALHFLIWRYRNYKEESFEESFLQLINACVVFIYVCLLFEMTWGNPFPNQYPGEPGDFLGYKAFFWNQNDLAVVLCGHIWLLNLHASMSRVAKVSFIALAASVMLVNGSKSALLGLLVILVISGIQFCSGNLNNGRRLALAAASFSAVGLIGLFIFAGELTFTTVQGTYTLRSILIEPLFRILTMTPTGGELGSIAARTDATIFVLKEYFSTWGLGLGPGGSWLVLSLPEYSLEQAKSPHNALLQFVADFGLPFLAFYFCCIFKAIAVAFSADQTALDRARATAILSFPIIGLSQSGAIITNYMFISCCVFLLLARNDRFECKQS